jgi:amino acid transporter
MTEETRNASMSGSIGIVTAIGVSAILGWFLILGLLFSIQDFDGTLSSSTGQPVTQIFLDTVGEKGAIVLMVFALLNSLIRSDIDTAPRSLSSVPCTSAGRFVFARA